MKDFLGVYLLNLWIYGSQAMVLYFAVRKLWFYYEAKKNKPVNVTHTLADVRSERIG